MLLPKISSLRLTTPKGGNSSSSMKLGSMTRSKNDNMLPNITTTGWKLQVLRKDGSTDWVPLKELKASNPVEVAEYAVGNQIADEPAFKWWVKDVLWRRNRIISKIKSRHWCTIHKFGIVIPEPIEDA